jgi:hypothetical protein
MKRGRIVISFRRKRIDVIMDIISANILLHHKQRIGIEVGKRIPSVWADEREDRLVCRSEGNENFEGAGTVGGPAPIKTGPSGISPSMSTTIIVCIYRQPV